MEDDKLSCEEQLTTEAIIELSQRLAKGDITPEHIEEFVSEMAAFD
ncbi:MAG TPA: hypothetical protein VFC63_06945 [Blastocatellia bacterium]|nr:hypothetical protein [Blastocatellia bacterium]